MKDIPVTIITATISCKAYLFIKYRIKCTDEDGNIVTDKDGDTVTEFVPDKSTETTDGKDTTSGGGIVTGEDKEEGWGEIIKPSNRG